MTPTLQNGIFLRDTNITATSYTDSYHLLNMMKDAEPMNLGPVDLWAMTQKVETPLYQFANFGGKNVIEVDNIRGEYTWQTPLSQDLPYIVEDVDPSNVTKGIDGTSFQIKINKRAYGPTDIITYDKYNGLELYVVPTAQILPQGDSFLYTVRLVNNNNNAFLNNQFLKSGTKIFRVGSAKSNDYGEKFSHMETYAGFREFYNFVGGADSNVEYAISSAAALMARNGMTSTGAIPVTEIWYSKDKTTDPSISSLSDMAKLMGYNTVLAAQKAGALNSTFLTKLEAAHLTKIAQDVETYLMWGKGGIVPTDGPDNVRLSVGLWRQLDNSFKRIYNRSGFSLDLFRSEIFNFFNGKVEFDGPDPQRLLVVQTGLGGFKLASNAIQQNAINSGMVINATEVGAITRSGKPTSGMDLNFGYAYTSFTIPFLATVKFVLNPAFDNIHTNDIENPIIDGFPLSSYSFVVFDVTDSGNDNIFLLKKKWDSQLKWFYQNGTMDYMGRTQGFASTGDFSGYRVKMSQAMPAIWVKDPTKVLKIVMLNPITGSSL